MSSKYLKHETCRLLTPLLISSMLVGCNINPAFENNLWGTDQTGLCERLTVVWPLKTEILQEIVGVNYAPDDRDSNGEGQLHLSVMKCGNDELAVAPTYVAHVLIPLAAESVPLIITSVSRDEWFSLPLTMLNRSLPVAGLFSRHNYVVIDTEITFEILQSNAETTLKARLEFENGNISMFATVKGEPESHATTSALLGTQANYQSVFFGKETANRQIPVSASVKIEGQTLFSDLNLSEIPATATFDSQLESNRMFWH